MNWYKQSKSSYLDEAYWYALALILHKDKSVEEAIVKATGKYPIDGVDLEWLKERVRDDAPNVHPSDLPRAFQPVTQDDIQRSREMIKNMSVTASAITPELWETMDHDKRHQAAYRLLSKKIESRIGLGLDDLPDTSEISVDNWWDENMSYEETISVISQAADEIASDLEDEGTGSVFF